jgi:hypothetical protein
VKETKCYGWKAVKFPGLRAYVPTTDIEDYALPDDDFIADDELVVHGNGVGRYTYALNDGLLRLTRELERRYPEADGLDRVRCVDGDPASKLPNHYKNVVLTDEPFMGTGFGRCRPKLAEFEAVVAARGPTLAACTSDEFRKIEGYDKGSLVAEDIRGMPGGWCRIKVSEVAVARRKKAAERYAKELAAAEKAQAARDAARRAEQAEREAQQKESVKFSGLYDKFRREASARIRRKARLDKESGISFGAYYDLDTLTRMYDLVEGRGAHRSHPIFAKMVAHYATNREAIEKIGINSRIQVALSQYIPKPRVRKPKVKLAEPAAQAPAESAATPA